jgi:uncharacterized protein YjiS (DUF1127 family)
LILDPATDWRQTSQEDGDMNCDHTRTLQTLPRRPVLLLLVKLWQQLRRWRALACQRQALARLDERMLKDIGLSRSDALQEISRPFWDDPEKH